MHVNHYAGKIVRDSSNFQNEKYIWPEGYSAVRKFTSFSGELLIAKVFLLFHFAHYDLYSSLISLYIALSASDPTVHTMYKMEVLRDVDSRTRPLFKVTGDNGEEVSDKAILSNLFDSFYLSQYVFLFICRSIFLPCSYAFPA